MDIVETTIIALYTLAVVINTLVVVGISLWTAGAIYFDVGRGRWLAWPLTLLWIVASVAALLFWKPIWQPSVVLLACFFLFLGWWFSQQPSQQREWDPNYTALPSFDIDGNVVTVHNVRNTVYRTLDDFTPQFETRCYHLSQLRGADAAITFWGSPWLCHPMLIFDFGKEGRLCISIEVRYRNGQKYGFLGSLYRQQEIMYVVSDERDAILRRSKYSENHDVYLYRLQAEPDEIRTFFSDYAARTNALSDTPHWYHGLTTNCTTSIYRQQAGNFTWDWRWLFNGKLDEMIYEQGRLDNRVAFSELKRQSLVNAIANRAPTEGFGEFVRRQLPAYR